MADACGKSLNFFIQLAPENFDLVGRRELVLDGLQQGALPLFIVGIGCREGVGWGCHLVDPTQFFGRKGVFGVVSRLGDCAVIGSGAFPVGNDGRRHFVSGEGAQSGTVASVVDGRDGREFESALVRINEREADIAHLKLRCSFVQPTMSALEASGDGGCGCRRTAAQQSVDLCSEPVLAE